MLHRYIPHCGEYTNMYFITENFKNTEIYVENILKSLLYLPPWDLKFQNISFCFFS